MGYFMPRIVESGGQKEGTWCQVLCLIDENKCPAFETCPVVCSEWSSTAQFSSRWGRIR